MISTNCVIIRSISTTVNPAIASKDRISILQKTNADLLVAGLDIIPCPSRNRVTCCQVGRRLRDFALRFGDGACQRPKGECHHENRDEVEELWKHHHGLQQKIENSKEGYKPKGKERGFAAEKSKVEGPALYCKQL